MKWGGEWGRKQQNKIKKHECGREGVGAWDCSNQNILDTWILSENKFNTFNF